MERKHYGAIDGLRTIAAIGIVMMHIAANNNYEISGFVYEQVIPSFTNFTFLFMTVSAFGMCCGYYEKIIQNQIAVADFYGKRFRKILPFFGLLVLFDVAVSPSLDAVYEAFADLTLLFGFLPGAGNISVIGVGWFLGLIFVFYLCFPFFCYLIENKKRAWFSFAVSIVYNFVCAQYFDVGRNNILYSGCFFLAGGLIYLYRNEIEKINSWLALGMVAVSVIAYYIIGGNSIICLLVSVALLSYAVIQRGGGVLQSRLAKFVSSISMEIYLSHMLVFRVLEKLHLNTIIGSSWLQYVVTVVMVIVGAAVFAVIMQRVIKVTESKACNKKVIE